MDAGLPDVSAWPGVAITSPLTGGARAAVFAARRGDERLVVKVSPRGPASLNWELDLLDALTDAGLTVPTTVPTADGRRRVGPVVVQRFLPGAPPSTAQQWAMAREAVERVHHLTRGWLQRPGSADAGVLMTAVRGADVDLSAMPGDAVALVRQCWQPLLEAAREEERCVVHGDLGAAAVLVGGDRVGIIDWDEARVDAPAFDLAALHAAAGPGLVDVPGLSSQQLADAALAWETATCWSVEPAYARRCLHQLREQHQGR